MTDEATCKGSWALGSACGRCSKCHEEARFLIPLLLRTNKAQREVLEAIADELEKHRRFVSNPLLVGKSIRAVLDEEK